MKKIIAICILMFTMSVSAGWLFNSFTDDQKEACQENIKLNSNKNIGACSYVGNAYLNGHRFDKSVGNASNYFYHGCGAGYLNGGVSDVDACVAGGDMFFNGAGDKYDGNGYIEKDWFEALEFYKKGCDLGSGYSCYSLGWMYNKGQGTVQNHFKATKYYRKSCDMESGAGCDALGTHYELGIGAKRSKLKALKYYRKACDLELQEGCDDYSRLN
jgi:TPR repeat protein